MEVVRGDKKKAEALGIDLRRGSCQYLRRRRGIVGLLMAASASMAVVALYQIGIFKGLPDLPETHFDSGKLTGSAKAYELLETPDTFLAMFSYAATMTLAAMGSSRRARIHPLLPIALATKVGLDAALATGYAVDGWRKQRALCSYCLVAAAATAVSFVLAFPEARSAIQQMK